MNKSLKHISIPIVTVAMVSVISFWAGKFATHDHTDYEFRMYYVDLTENSDKLTPQCREYLKCQLYRYAAVYISPNGYPNYKFDFGPVDEEILAGLNANLKDQTPLDVYNRAMEKHGQKGRGPSGSRLNY